VSSNILVGSITTNACCPANSTANAQGTCSCNANYYPAGNQPNVGFACLNSAPANA